MVEGAVIAEKKVVLSNTVLPDGEVKRIFIGGVGGGVTAIDMEKTFSPLGRVHAVEFVRTNGRNFAFMDFEPSSVRSLAKLFSAYNGCTWKGGKLKLEMAKEHYLARLKKEWVKDAKLASVPPPTEENLEFVRSHCSNQENLQIRIFFPKLRKVKPLPFKGSGKHKYSFQRIDVPPLPIHFCDCEEHSKALETTYQKYLSPLSTVMHEKEQNIRSNVINKLMGGDNDEIPSDRNMLFASDPKTLSPYNEDIHSKETEVSDIDDDNLVMNIGAGAGDDLLMQLKGGMTPSTCQESEFGNSQSSQGRLVQNKVDSGKRKKAEVSNASSIKSNKRARLVSADGFSKSQPALDIPQKVTSAYSAVESVSSFSLTSLEGPAHAPKIRAETPTAERHTRQNTSNAQPADGYSWVQKSSWRDLVGEKGSSSFSISTLLSGITSASPEMPKSNASDNIARPAAKKPESFGNKPKQKTPQNVEVSPGMNPKVPLSAGVLEKDTKNTSYFVKDKPSEGQTSIVQEHRKEIPEFSFGEVCPFMRSAESEQQWSKTKAALSGYFKRKSNEGNASKFSKGMTPARR